MAAEKRKSRRKPLRHTAWIHVKGAAPQGCTVSDISQTGARLDTLSPADLPDRFILLLSNRGTARRQCRTVWRSHKQIGVEFETT